MRASLPYLVVLLVVASLAATLQAPQITIVQDAPIYSDPSRSVVSAVTASGTTAIADLAAPVESSYQRLKISNLSSTALVCVYWVAAGASCGSSVDCDMSGTDDGDLVWPRSTQPLTAAGDLRTCVVADTSPTTVHTSRSLVE